MHEVLVNRLGGLSLPRKSVVRLTDRPDMTLDVYRGPKTKMQQLFTVNVYHDSDYGHAKYMSKINVSSYMYIKLYHSLSICMRRESTSFSKWIFPVQAD